MDAFVVAVLKRVAACLALVLVLLFSLNTVYGGEKTMEIICIIDQSGSMGNLASDAIGGFNHFLETQKGLPGETKITTILFNTKIT